MQPLLVRLHRPYTWAVAKHIHSKRPLAGNASESPLRSLLEEASAFGELEAEAAEPELRWVTQPYAARPRGAARAARVEPAEAAVLLFPGADEARAGMGRALLRYPAARQLYELASSVVGWDVAHACAEGDAEALAACAHTAALVTALAALERARDERPAALQRARAAAGAGPAGELAALVFADALPLERALRLAELVGAGERAAMRERPAAALALRLAPDARLPALLAAARSAARPGAVCAVARYSHPACKTVAGDEEAVRFVEARGAEFGVLRSSRARGGALHTPLAEGAARALAAALAGAGAELRAPRLRVLAGAEARAYGSAAHVRRALPRLLRAPLRWEQALHALFARPRGERFPLVLALAPAAALRADLRRVNARAWDCSLAVED